MWQHDTNNATVVFEEASQPQNTGKVMIIRILLRRRPMMLIVRLHICDSLDNAINLVD
jgi:hypothetical protein